MLFFLLLFDLSFNDAHSHTCIPYFEYLAQKRIIPLFFKQSNFYNIIFILHGCEKEPEGAGVDVTMSKRWKKIVESEREREVGREKWNNIIERDR